MTQLSERNVSYRVTKQLTTYLHMTGIQLLGLVINTTLFTRLHSLQWMLTNHVLVHLSTLAAREGQATHPTYQPKQSYSEPQSSQVNKTDMQHMLKV